MYKTVSTALQSKPFKLTLPAVIIGVLTVVAWRNFKNVDILSTELIADQIRVFLCIAALAFLNLYFEMRKWTTLIQSRHLDRRVAFKAVLIGMCSGFVTPNRLGEFAGRAVAVPRRLRKKASVMTFAGAGIQGSVTFLAGIIGLFIYPILPQMPTYGDFKPQIFYGLMVVGVALAIFFWFKKPLKPHIQSIVKRLKAIEPKTLIKAWLWAAGRYAIFSTQFVIALYSVGFSGDILTCYAGVFVLYFIQSYMPFTAMGELGVRELLAIFIFGKFLDESLLAAFATLMVWVANIGIPVLIGALSLKFHKSRILGNT